MLICQLSSALCSADASPVSKVQTRCACMSVSSSRGARWAPVRCLLRSCDGKALACLLLLLLLWAKC